jgi:hypothetical protein
MNVKCIECGYNLNVSTGLISKVIGTGLISTGVTGWFTFAFAGLLGFQGGALLIALALLAGGGAALAGKDSQAIIAIGQKITDLLNYRNHTCPKCNESRWAFTGYKDTEIVTGVEHKQELTSAFKIAKQELCIASGFLSSNVVNANFIRDLETVLRKNVNVKLIFSDVRSHGGFMESGYQKALDSLVAIAGCSSHLELIQKHTHQKGIVVDEQYAISGSFNFLSNKNVNKQESSLKIYSPKAIKKFKRDLLTLSAKNT